MMTKAMLSFVLAAFMTVALLPVSTAAEKKAPNMSRMTHVGRVVTDKPIQIGLENKGVKLESIAFDGEEAAVVVWNRTPNAIKGHVGLALYDRNNHLLAAESDSASFTRTFTQVRAGKQATFKVKFDKFLEGNLNGVAKYALVFVTEK